MSQVKAYPAGRIGTAIDIEKVSNFLANIKAFWQKWPNPFKNEFLRIVLDRVYITPVEGGFHARIVWKNGFEQALCISRPLYQTTADHLWTSEELSLLRKHFAKTSWAELFRLLPSRTYGSITDHAHRLGLKRAAKPYGRRNPFTSEEDAIVLQVANEDLNLADALDQLDRTPNAILNRMARLGYPASRFWEEKRRY